MTGEVRPVRVLLRLQETDQWQRPTGDPVWLDGLAQLGTVGESSGAPPVLELAWLAVEGRYYTVSTEEPTP